MAHGRPWYKRNGADFVVGCMSLPDAEHKWAYSAIVDMLNDLDRPLPDEPSFICGFTGLSKRKWAVVRATLLAQNKLIETGDGYLTNPRFEREREERDADHQRAVETGRQGGKKAAAMRAAGQGEMDLGGDKVAEKSEKSAPKTGDNRKINGELQPQKPQKTDDPDQGGLKPARARRGERLENLLPNEQLIDAAEERPVDGGKEPDLWTLTHACCDAAGLSVRFASRPALMAQSMDIVKNWIAAGVDIEGTALPVIQNASERASEPAHSLAKFAAAVDTAHSRKRQADRAGTAPPPKPATAVYQFDGEAPPMVQFRKDVAQAIGVGIYARWCGAVNFTVEDLGNTGDMQLLALRNSGTSKVWNAARVLDHHGPAIVKIARAAFGVREVWESTAAPPAPCNRPSGGKP